MSTIILAPAVPPSSPACIEAVQRITTLVKAVPQLDIVTHHSIHAGVYTRSITIPAGATLTGALIKIPTTLVISGHASMLMGDGFEALVDGYVVLPAAAGRRQAYLAHTDTQVTMIFRTDAKTVEEAEREFTDETEALMSRSGENIVVITGE